MFWKFGGYGSVSPIDAILDRPDFTLEELLDESDLLGDIKALNSKLLDYLRQPDVISSLLNLVVAPKLEPVVAPENEEADKDTTADAVDKDEKTEDASSDAPNSRTGSGRVRLLALGRGRSRSSSSATDGDFEEEDEAEKKRNKYAYVACEVLACDNWAISDTLLDPANRGLLHKFWQFLKRPAPLDPLQAGYFTKVNESLFDKKVDEMVEFLKTADNAVQDMLRHVDSPMIMDLLLKIIILDRPEACQGIVEWLYTQDIIPTLLSFLSPENSWATQTSAGDFIKAIITVSANATQHEQTCIGPNELTRQLVSRPCIDELIGYMLNGGNALTVGVGIVIEVIRKNNSDYDPDVGTEANSQPSSRDPIYLGTLLRMFAQNVPNFMKLMGNTPAQKARLNSTFGEKIEPLGFDRFKTCELMAELLHCSNMGLLNEAGAEELIEARDAERNRLRSEGKLTPNRGEEAPSSTDLMTMRLGHSSPADEGRRLEITNSTAADEDGFEEVTHAAGLGEESSADQQLLPPAPILPSNGPVSPSQPFMDKDEDDFVDEPLSSPRLETHDSQGGADNGLPFDDPDMLVAPLSPNKKRDPAATAANTDTAEKKEAASAGADSTSKDGLGEGAEDFVTEATEPALGEEAKRMVPDLERSDESDSSILFTPTISSLSESLDLQPPSQRAPSPPPEAPEVSESTGKQSSVAEDEGDKQKETSDAAPRPVSLEAEKPAPPAAEAAAETKPAADATTAPADNEDATNKAQPAVADEKPLAEDDAERSDADAEMEDGSIVIATRPSVADATNESFVTESRFSDPVVGDFLKMQFVDHRVIPSILSLFFSYPWNNFLHNVVYDVVQQVFNGPMDRGFNPDLAVSLFESADITNQIINGQLVSEQSQAATRMRMGYMGHLTLIAEEVVKFTERNPPELLSESVLEKVMSPDWIKYVEGPLAETRERDNAILGGVRPEVAMGNQAAAAGLAAVGLSGLGSSLGLSGSQGTSSALADAGLNGTLDLHDSDLPSGHEGGMNPFSISAGISSGFHSSSDEEDDDADDNDDEISNAFRAYTDPLNTTSSLLPPAIPPPPPPPPPPLNVPPSRARRQLAARLAMNKRNAEASAAASAAGGQEDDDAGAEEGRYNGSNGAEEEGDAKAAADAASGDLSLRGDGLDSDNNSGGPVKTLTELLLQATQDGGRMRNPFADDDDDDDDDDDERDERDERDEGDDEDDDEDNELYHANDEEEGGPGGGRRGGGGDVGRVGLGWNRGSWWRAMVQRDRKSKQEGNRRAAAEGDDGGGLDDLSSDEEARSGGGQEVARQGANANEANDGTTAAGHTSHAADDKHDENDDEEFGDFAMPESVAAGASAGAATAAAATAAAATDSSSSSSSSGPAAQAGADGGDKGFVRPLALHPASLTKRSSESSTAEASSEGGGGGGGSNNPGSGLWSFERFGFLGGVGKDGTAATATVTTTTAATGAEPTGTSSLAGDDGLEVVLGADGRPAGRAAEAKRRTSLDGDEDEVVV